MNSAPTRPGSAGKVTAPTATRSQIHRFRLATAVAWTIVIMVLCWIPGNMVNKIEQGSRWFKVPSLDKLVHGAIFIVFSILWARLGTSRRRFLWIAIAGIGLGVLTELVQKLAIVGRDGTLGDGAVDIAGILVGIVAAPLVEPFARFIESRIFRRTALPIGPTRGTTVSVEEAARSVH